MPWPAEEDLDEAAFALCYQQFGGCGTTLVPSEVDNLPLPKIWWWLERLSEQREREEKILRQR